MLKPALVLSAMMVCAMLLPAAPAAARECGARTCKQAFDGCMALNCPSGLRCGNVCRSKFTGCLQTGRWKGRSCNMRNLVRR